MGVVGSSHWSLVHPIKAQSKKFAELHSSKKPRILLGTHGSEQKLGFASSNRLRGLADLV